MGSFASLFGLKVELKVIENARWLGSKFDSNVSIISIFRQGWKIWSWGLFGIKVKVYKAYNFIFVVPFIVYSTLFQIAIVQVTIFQKPTFKGD